MSAFVGIESAGVLPEGPVASLEFKRIMALPRRFWVSAPDLDDLILGLTEMLRRPEGQWTLKATQAAALRDLYDFGGLFGPIAVGGGKTLITLLAPVLMQAKRPVLLVPAALRDQTFGKVLPEMRKHWKLHENLTIVGYSELSLQRKAGLLDELQPDMIIADECHYLKNPKSARTRRVSRYMAKHPMTTFVAVSGTVANHSIMHYWHLIQWALKPDGAPIPRTYHEARHWACAIDERVAPDERVGVGVLTELFLDDPVEDPHPQSSQLRARRGYRQRLVETPGVVATEEDRLGVSLRLMSRDPWIPEEVNHRVREIKETWTSPDGVPLLEAVEVWRLIRQCVAGFFYRWTEQPPGEWLDARKEWNSFVRHMLKTNRRKLDTPLQIWNDVKKNGGAGSHELERWMKVKDDFKPVTEAVWFHDYLVADAAAWLLTQPGLCWVEYDALGKRIAAAVNVPYFGAGDSRILDWEDSCVASIAAHGTGKNLQQWNRNLVVIPPTSGQIWEQLLGRTHRMGQQEDTVVVETYLHHRSYQASMSQAFADARFLQETLGNAQRLLYCDNAIPQHIYQEEINYV